jgi:hypothetical protein
MPITAPTKQWTWIGVDGTQCRDGSPTGIGVYLTGSDKLVIYLEGGGACFSGATCYVNPSSFGAADLPSVAARNSGIFDLARMDNPFYNWNFVYVPYCTGDTHAGNADGVDVPGNGPKGQHFVGYSNVARDLARLVPTFPNVTQVVLTGASAGGFGASWNYDQVAGAFCPRPVVLVDDSGPAMPDDVLAPCLQQRWRDLWKLPVPADCADCTQPDGGGMINYSVWLAGKYPKAQLGLIESDQDSVISRFYGYGANNCASIDSTGQVASVPAATYEAGLLATRQTYVQKAPAWSTFFVTSTQHTWELGDTFYTQAEDGVTMADWVRSLIAGGAATQLGPN